MGVNQKMKLYNVYRICKQNIDYFEKPNLTKQVVENNNVIFQLENWTEYKEKLKNLRRLPILKNYIDNYFDIIPIFIIEKRNTCRLRCNGFTA